MFSKIFPYLNSEIDSIANVHQGFGYRERMQIERGLFLLVKSLCHYKLGFNLQGFSNAHKEKILELIESNKCENSFLQLIERVFQLKIFIQSLSAESAYVRGDALSQLGLDRQNVFDFISAEIGRIRDRSIASNNDQVHSKAACGTSGIREENGFGDDT